ncbi:MAG: helix-turn-helix transcriptional regulator [Oscillospiraceae bacterium]|nr:helix-turn-helix transcriptional regulator [Oscillospiraceae bacterium]
MEKKTIGGFIAALRKANGMTQKDLAEKLNVSDKTVSRWERDDGAPDLAVIPVIAEIFGVTCDELLRGERKPPIERTGTAQEAESTPKAEKQRQHLLKSTFLQYKNHTYIAMGISVMGIIAALICNLAFLKAVLGFFLGAIFFAAGIVCQAIFINKAFFSVEDAGLDTDVLSDYNRKIIVLAEKSIGLTVAFIGFTFPLILVDAYMGLGSDSLLIWGALGTAAFLLIYSVVLYFLNASFLKKGIYRLSEKEYSVYCHNHKLKRTCAIFLAVLLAFTGVGHHVATSIWGPYSIMKGTTFEDYESFIEYMEQDVPSEHEYGANYNGSATSPVPEEEIGSAVYYDEFGNEISKEEALTTRLKDKNGNVVCEYISRRSFVSLRYTPKDGTVLPITVCTEDDLFEARETAAVRHVIFGTAYCVECIAVLLIYFIKRAK